MSDEITLLKRARQFDEQALAEIYDNLSPAIYAYTMRLCGDPETAEECVSETFSRFLTALRHGQGPNEHIKAYLYRIAHNWITDRYRRVRPETMLDPELRASPENEPHVVATKNLEQQELRAALMLLTPEQRQVIALKYLEDLDADEIAGVLQKPVGAIRALQHRALASLRKILGAHAGVENDPTLATQVGPDHLTKYSAGGSHPYGPPVNRSPGVTGHNSDKTIPSTGKPADGKMR
jgi:RNA polymerase sigma-70 factor, ECF subfamily